MGSWAKGAGPDRRSVRRSRLVRFGRHIFDWQLGATRSCVFETVKSIRYHAMRSEEHTSELQSQTNLVCRLLLDETTGSAAGEADGHRQARSRPASRAAPVR